MAIRKKRSRSSRSDAQMTPGQASYVLERIVKDKRVSRGDVSRYLSEMQSEIGDLERRLQSLRDAAGEAVAVVRRGLGRAAVAVRGAVGGDTPARKSRKRRSKITAEQRASRVLQGRYLGLIRQIPASRRAGIKKIAKEKGREAAIKEMSSILGK